MSLLRIRNENGVVHEVFALKGNPGEKGADGTVSFDELTEEQITSLKGVGIANMSINDNGQLEIEYTNGTKDTLGKIVGDKGNPGEKGDTGVGIKNINIDGEGYLYIEYTNEEQDKIGKIVGDPGVGIESLQIVDGNLVVNYTDGCSDTVGKVVGEVPPDYGHNKFANALKGKSEGAQSVSATDVSPFEHDVVLKVSSLNLLNNNPNLLTEENKVSYKSLDTQTGELVDRSRYGYSIHLPAGKYCIYAKPTEGSGYKDGMYIYHAVVADKEAAATLGSELGGNPVVNTAFGNKIDINMKTDFDYLVFNGNSGSTLKDSKDIFGMFDIMLARGNDALEFVPYITDLSKVEIATPEDDGKQFTIHHTDSAGVLTVKSTKYALSFSAMRPVYMELTYNRDINKVIERLENAIGGNV